ncbi:hypothetical protein [Acrocarpospora sp. B8E8]|uniref:hypothetical protein n=1 Tax=Acrocarpospora sp. B8E8 TaxID=3153572 RepID=UPI00325DA3DE
MRISRSFEELGGTYRFASYHADFYNTVRRHSANDGLSPITFKRHDREEESLIGPAEDRCGRGPSPRFQGDRALTGPLPRRRRQQVRILPSGMARRFITSKVQRDPDTPFRFRRAPTPPSLPEAVWINEPAQEEENSDTEQAA